MGSFWSSAGEWWYDFSVIGGSDGFGLCDFQVKLGIFFQRCLEKFGGLRFCYLSEGFMSVFVCDFPDKCEIFSCEGQIYVFGVVGFGHFASDFQL